MRRLIVEFEDRLGLGPLAEALSSSRLVHQHPTERGLRLLVQAQFQDEAALEDALLLLRRSHAASLRSRLAPNESLLTLNVVHPMFRMDMIQQNVLLLDLSIGLRDGVRATFGVPPFRIEPFIEDIARIGVRSLMHTPMPPMDAPHVDQTEDDRVLRLAWSMGYFDQPKGAGLNDIARRERKSTTAVRRKVMRGVERLLEQRYGRRVI
jgi:hypothetical protein